MGGQAEGELSELIRGLGTPGQMRVGGRACARPMPLRSTREAVRLVAASAEMGSGEVKGSDEVKVVSQQWHNEHQVRCDPVTSVLSVIGK